MVWSVMSIGIIIICILLLNREYKKKRLKVEGISKSGERLERAKRSWEFGVDKSDTRVCNQPCDNIDGRCGLIEKSVEGKLESELQLAEKRYDAVFYRLDRLFDNIRDSMGESCYNHIYSECLYESEGTKWSLRYEVKTCDVKWLNSQSVCGLARPQVPDKVKIAVSKKLDMLAFACGTDIGRYVIRGQGHLVNIEKHINRGWSDEGGQTRATG